ncbi:hypothetical protein Zmor_003621 [Zophobas morio]|uniref:Uncharacterized protein n=1 Tax=Zophobas morio TaxID=2755281 RepID=A0AA38M2T9_9CUCU|nr:hypothetical protein Zmor_003621 [Zophobas morio]
MARLGALQSFWEWEEQCSDSWVVMQHELFARAGSVRRLLGGCIRSGAFIIFRDDVATQGDPASDRKPLFSFMRRVGVSPGPAWWVINFSRVRVINFLLLFGQYDRFERPIIECHVNTRVT